MSISSSLNAGVSGLNVNASRLASISDNIANSNTFGYKRAIVDFRSMVIDRVSNSYSAGGVRTTVSRQVDQNGTLINTENPTDLAITGRGMLPVTTVAALDNEAQSSYPLMLTSTASFRPDSAGVLRTDTGLVLMGWPAKIDGTIPDFPRTTVDGLQPLRVNLHQFAGDPTSMVELGVNLPATETQAGKSGKALNMSVEYFGNLGTAENLNLEFTPTVPAAGSAPSNTWNMTIKDGGASNQKIGEYTLVFDATQANGGSLDSVTTVSGGAYDPATGQIALTVGANTIQLNIGKLKDNKGLSQLSNTFAPLVVNKNGSPVGNLSSVSVDENGYMSAIYDTGFTKRIYQIPVADVPNLNGLIGHHNQAFQVSPQSGPFFLWNAGDGPTGAMAGFTMEESATDMASELTQLIQTQRAYSSNAKVIQTVDEMLQETTNIKR